MRSVVKNRFKSYSAQFLPVNNHSCDGVWYTKRFKCTADIMSRRIITERMEYTTVAHVFARITIFFFVKFTRDLPRSLDLRLVVAVVSHARSLRFFHYSFFCEKKKIMRHPSAGRQWLLSVLERKTLPNLINARRIRIRLFRSPYVSTFSVALVEMRYDW